MAQPSTKPHVAVTMDGNGRSATNQSLNRSAGHTAGATCVKPLVLKADAMGIRTLTLFAFAEANWSREKPEVDFLLELIADYINQELTELHERKVRWKFIGRRSALPESLQAAMGHAEQVTQDNTGLTLVIAINYSSSKGYIDGSEDLPDVDIVIRTGLDENDGRTNFYVNRPSNFLMDKRHDAIDVAVTQYFPDFTPELFAAAVAAAGLEEQLHGGQRPAAEEPAVAAE